MRRIRIRLPRARLPPVKARLRQRLDIIGRGLKYEFPCRNEAHDEGRAPGMKLKKSPQPVAVASLDLFAGLYPAALAEVTARARIQTLARGARVFNQDERIERAHALLSGAVRISQIGSDGGEVVMRFIRPGEIFGSVGIFTDDRYPADGTTLIESIEASWPRADLVEMIGKHPEIALNLVGIVGRRLAELQERVREMATQRVEQRIANALLRLAQSGTVTERGAQIAFPLRRKDIADISGTTLHTVSRTLNDWRRRGLVVDDRSGLTLTSPEKLGSTFG